jgi:hypothetical protein
VRPDHSNLQLELDAVEWAPPLRDIVDEPTEVAGKGLSRDLSLDTKLVD